MLLLYWIFKLSFVIDNYWDCVYVQNIVVNCPLQTVASPTFDTGVACSHHPRNKIKEVPASCKTSCHTWRYFGNLVLKLLTQKICFEIPKKINGVFWNKHPDFRFFPLISSISWKKKAACDEKASFSMSNLISNVQLTMPGMCGRRRVKN